MSLATITLPRTPCPSLDTLSNEDFGRQILGKNSKQPALQANDETQAGNRPLSHVTWPL